jgi:ureidoacrylate peracid hydrolase
MVEFEIEPRKSCLLIIDMTSAFLSPGAPVEIPGGRSLIPKLKRLTDVCRDKGLPIVFTTHAYRKDGCDLGLHANFFPEMKARDILREGTPDIEFYGELQPQKDDIVIVKRRFSAFLGTELDLTLRNKEIDTLIIGGVATNVCCETTARDARMRDYKVIFLSDGTANRGLPDMGWGEMSPEEVQRAVLTIMAFHFAQVSSVEEVKARLLKLPV